MTHDGWTIRKARSLSEIFGRSMKVFFSTPEMEICLSSSNIIFFIMVRGDIFSINDFFCVCLPPTSYPFLFNGDIPKLKQLFLITEGRLKVNDLEKSNL